ncbi:MAG: hypothetical protein mread185_000002 [Mycoplasmataceae bacterium]|nr:MAG: hypothetical protein mread185_000002 [Mycoplasmataceae bacterium]
MRLFYVTFNTNLNNDLENLPAILEDFYCFACPQIESKLLGYGKTDDRGRTRYDYQAWRNDNQELIRQAQIEILHK